jgi:hypothetical protein
MITSVKGSLGPGIGVILGEGRKNTGLRSRPLHEVRRRRLGFCHENPETARAIGRFNERYVCYEGSSFPAWSRDNGHSS